MAKPLLFTLGEDRIPLTLNKIDRSRLYGSKEVEVVDENDEACDLVTLADDGRTMIGRGGTGLGWLDADGKWCDKSQLKPVNVDGDEIEPVASSFNAPIRLFETASVEQLLQHNIRLAYVLQWVEETRANDASAEGVAAANSDGLRSLRRELDRGTIFSFPYSYRGGLEADAAFLLANEEGEMILAVGTPTDVAFVGIQSQVAILDDSLGENDVEEMDFEMI